MTLISKGTSRSLSVLRKVLLKDLAWAALVLLEDRVRCHSLLDLRVLARGASVV